MIFLIIKEKEKKMFSRRTFIKLGLLTLTGLNGKTVSNYLAQNKSKNLYQKMKHHKTKPSYLELHNNGELKVRGQKLWKMMQECKLCPRQCKVNRMDGERGFCGADSNLEIASYAPHFGEERPLVGQGGSGTIFLTHCSLRCVFCINPDISQEGYGTQKSINDFAGMMLRLQKMGCENINIVTPTHYIPHLILALDIASRKGLNIPLVYNTSGYERVEILTQLDGIVDIYLPDFKYAGSKMASRFSSGAKDYPELAKNALLEMNRQVGIASSNSKGIMQRGLMIRHLVMPNNVSGTDRILAWIADNLPKHTYINLMSQYRPVYKAHNYPKISRRISQKEYKQAIKWGQDAGLTNLHLQGHD